MPGNTSGAGRPVGLSKPSRRGRAGAEAIAGLVGTVSPRRLLVVCHTHPRLTQGGAEIAAYEQHRRALAEPGTETWFLASNGAKHGGKLGIAIQQPFGPREFLHTGHAFDDFKLSNPDPAFEREFGALLRELRPNEVHFHHFLGVGVEAFLHVRRHAPQARIVVTLHEYLLICHHFGQMVTRPDHSLCHAASPQRCHGCFPEHSPRSFFLRELWLKRFLREVDQFVSPSRFLRDRYVAWGVPAERIVVAENVLPEHPPVPARRVRRPGDPLRVAYFGQLSPLKGIEVFLRAARQLSESGRPISFRIYGSYESQPFSLQQRVREVIDNMPTNVSYKGSYRNADVIQLMAENDVVAVPSIWWENSPLVIQEAKAAGCIVVGSDIGGVREKVGELERGLIFECNDANDLADKLVALQAPCPQRP